jgi:hypothetical protein
MPALDIRQNVGSYGSRTTGRGTGERQRGTGFQPVKNTAKMAVPRRGSTQPKNGRATMKLAGAEIKRCGDQRLRQFRVTPECGGGRLIG